MIDTNNNSIIFHGPFMIWSLTCQSYLFQVRKRFAVWLHQKMRSDPHVKCKNHTLPIVAYNTEPYYKRAMGHSYHREKYKWEGSLCNSVCMISARQELKNGNKYCYLKDHLLQPTSLFILFNSIQSVQLSIFMVHTKAHYGKLSW